MNKYLQMFLAILVFLIGVCFYIIWPVLFKTLLYNIGSVIGLGLIIGGIIWFIMKFNDWIKEIK